MRRKPEVSIIYVYFNTPEDLLDSINTIVYAAGNLSYEIIIVDNASIKKILLPNKKSNIRIIRSDKNRGYGGGLNLGAKYAEGEFLLLTNPDILFAPNSIEKMVSSFQSNSKVGLLGPQILRPDNTIAKTYSGSPLLPNSLVAFSFIDKYFPRNRFSEKYWLHSSDRNKERLVDTIGGACMMVSRKVFEKVGGFDERFFLFFEETDFSLRVKKEEYKILYDPSSKILHLGARSMKDEEFINRNFEKSRFKFYSKYHGFLKAFFAEAFLRFTKKENFSLFLILILSLFLNLYRLDRYMLFIGDSARDYLAARDMILTHTIPLVGIPSSVVWLHQGPLSIYFIGIAFLFSNFNPIAPAVLYGLIGVLTTFFLYKLGSMLFNKDIGLLSSLFYATSPSIITNARMPYHTSSIPLFTILCFIFLKKILDGNKKCIFFIFLSFGLLLQVELSNIVFILVFLSIFYLKRINFKKNDVLKAIEGFVIGILPFIFYDVTHKFIYSVGFPLWIINRIRLFFGVATVHSTANIGEALTRIYQQAGSIIFTSNLYIFQIIFLITFLVILLNLIRVNKMEGFRIILLWLAIPVLAFMIHSSPGTAYFPALFPALALLLGFVAHTLKRYTKGIVIMTFILICLFNSYSIVKNEYYITNIKRVHSLPPFGYSLGPSISIIDDVSRFISKDSNCGAVNIKPGGFISRFPTSVDSYKYMTWFYGGKISNKGKVYVVYENEKQIPKNQDVVYTNGMIFVTRP